MTELDLNEASIKDAAVGLRRLTDLLLRVEENEPALVEIADELERLEIMLEKSTRAPEFFDPVCGRGNALAPPLEMEMGAEGGAMATGSLGLAYQGPQGLVHGGMSALMLDHVLRLTHPHFSGPDAIEELSVRYHRPLPLFEELVVIGTPAIRDGSAGAHGEITVDGHLAVSADALFRDRPNP